MKLLRQLGVKNPSLENNKLGSLELQNQTYNFNRISRALLVQMFHKLAQFMSSQQEGADL